LQIQRFQVTDVAETRSAATGESPTNRGSGDQFIRTSGVGFPVLQPFWWLPGSAAAFAGLVHSWPQAGQPITLAHRGWRGYKLEEWMASNHFLHSARPGQMPAVPALIHNWLIDEKLSSTKLARIKTAGSFRR